MSTMHCRIMNHDVHKIYSTRVQASKRHTGVQLSKVTYLCKHLKTDNRRAEFITNSRKIPVCKCQSEALKFHSAFDNKAGSSWFIILIFEFRLHGQPIELKYYYPTKLLGEIGIPIQKSQLCKMDCDQRSHTHSGHGPGLENPKKESASWSIKSFTKQCRSIARAATEIVTFGLINSNDSSESSGKRVGSEDSNTTRQTPSTHIRGGPSKKRESRLPCPPSNTDSNHNTPFPHGYSPNADVQELQRQPHSGYTTSHGPYYVSKPANTLLTVDAHHNGEFSPGHKLHRNRLGEYGGSSGPVKQASTAQRVDHRGITNDSVYSRDLQERDDRILALEGAKRELEIHIEQLEQEKRELSEKSTTDCRAAQNALQALYSQENNYKSANQRSEQKFRELNSEIKRARVEFERSLKREGEMKADLRIAQFDIEVEKARNAKLTNDLARWSNLDPESKRDDQHFYSLFNGIYLSIQDWILNTFFELNLGDRMIEALTQQAKERLDGIGGQDWQNLQHTEIQLVIQGFVLGEVMEQLLSPLLCGLEIEGEACNNLYGCLNGTVEEKVRWKMSTVDMISRNSQFPEKIKQRANTVAVQISEALAPLSANPKQRRLKHLKAALAKAAMASMECQKEPSTFRFESYKRGTPWDVTSMLDCALQGASSTDPISSAAQESAEVWFTISPAVIRLPYEGAGSERLVIVPAKVMLLPNASMNANQQQLNEETSSSIHTGISINTERHVGDAASDHGQCQPPIPSPSEGQDHLVIDCDEATQNPTQDALVAIDDRITDTPQPQTPTATFDLDERRRGHVEHSIPVIGDPMSFSTSQNDRIYTWRHCHPSSNKCGKCTVKYSDDNPAAESKMAVHMPLEAKEELEAQTQQTFADNGSFAPCTTIPLAETSTPLNAFTLVSPFLQTSTTYANIDAGHAFTLNGYVDKPHNGDTSEIVSAAGGLLSFTLTDEDSSIAAQSFTDLQMLPEVVPHANHDFGLDHNNGVLEAQAHVVEVGFESSVPTNSTMESSEVTDVDSVMKDIYDQQLADLLDRDLDMLDIPPEVTQTESVSYQI
ncbi:hypothetical protein DFH27DRAFT_602279 [Peziza echinospora]|nr:hypothetical protein DFH27DRAFT_602279 [Peziza echinospora]